MSYSNFTTENLKERFGVEEIFRARMSDDVESCAISDLLKTFLAQNTDFAILQKTEKARSEFIIAPIFYSARQPKVD